MTTLLPTSARLLLFLLLLSTAAARPAPLASDAERFSQLERVILDELKATGTPGAAIVVIKDGRLAFARGFGVASIETGVAVTPDTLFRLGSTTKMMTGAALVHLAEKGRLKLDAPIGNYAAGLAPELSRLTTHQLLSNTAGVADFSPPFVSHDDKALATMVRSWKGDALFAGGGHIYSYSSPGFWLAGYVIEELTGKPYADAMTEFVFQPLGMGRTTLRPLVALTYPLALGHEAPAAGKAAVIRPTFNNVAMWPAGSIYSTADDLSRFVIALLAGGKLGGQAAMPPALFAQLSAKHVQLPGETDVYYGYGLMNFAHRGVRIVMHGGFSRGYGSMIQMAPDHRFAIIVLTNRSGQTLNRTTDKAKELFLPLTPAAAESPKKALPLGESDLRAFAGTYANGPQTWEIIAKGGRLLFKSEDRELALTKVAPNRLAYGENLDAELVMVPGAEGRAEYLFDGLYSARRQR